jgi:hypothetical protein
LPAEASASRGVIDGLGLDVEHSLSKSVRCSDAGGLDLVGHLETGE